MSEYIDINKYIKKKENMALAKYEDDVVITIKLVPYKEISYKYDSGYGAYSCEEIIDKDEMPETFNISGNFISPLRIGQSYEATGTVHTYNKSKQLKVSNIKNILPQTDRTIKQLLKSLEGMGPFSDILCEEFGNKVFDVIKTNPQKILETAPGLYKDLVLSWRKQLLSITDEQEYLTNLISYGMKAIQAKMFYDKYENLSLIKIKENPYILSKEIKGFGFLKCDNIAKNSGYDLNSHQRIEEAIIYILRTSKNDGNTYLPKSLLKEKVHELLNVKLGVNDMKALYKENKNKESALYTIGNLKFNININDLKNSLYNYKYATNKKEKEACKLLLFNVKDDKVNEAIKTLNIGGRIICKNDKIYDKELYYYEEFIAMKLYSIEQEAKNINYNLEKRLKEILEKDNIILEKEQYKAVIYSASKIGGFSYINGSAGCGKTFTLNIALSLIEEVYKEAFGYFEPIILAPTGRAAKVAANATGREALTIHRALKASLSQGFYYNHQNYLPYNCIICDETSMLDVELARFLFDAISNNTKIIFVGDTKQLSSVGPGNVLKDILLTHLFNGVSLTVAKRQALDSGIYKNAQRIINGEMIKTEKETNDAFVFKSTSNQDCLNKTLKVFEKVSKTININKIQVLSPQKTGLTGVNYLNFVLQDKYNKNNEGNKVLNKNITVTFDDGKTGKFELYYKKGDKVIHTKNNYNLPWYKLKNNRLILSENQECGITNGETGIIIEILKEKDKNRNYVTKIIVQYEDKFIVYVDDFSELDHAYCITIHKSQGSEWPVVIIPITFSAYSMLSRNLLYTGYTRAKKWISVIGDERAIKYTIDNVEASARYTGLDDRLLEVFADKGINAQKELSIL